MQSPRDSLGIDVGGSSVKPALLCVAATVQTPWKLSGKRKARPTTSPPRSNWRRRFARRSPVGFPPAHAAVFVSRACGCRQPCRSIVGQSPRAQRLEPRRSRSRRSRPIARALEVLTDAVANAYDLYAIHNLRGRLLSLALGTGVGAAVIDEGGIPLKVDGESPGHIGQVDCSIAGDDCLGPDGGAGSLEGYIGTPALIKRYGPDMAANLQRLGPNDAPLKALARAIRICHGIYCPQHVALTGGLGNRMNHLLPVLRTLVDTNLTSIAKKNWSLLCGNDDFHAAKGAAKFAARK